MEQQISHKEPGAINHHKEDRIMNFLRKQITEKGTFTITNVFNRDVVMHNGQLVEGSDAEYVLDEMVKENIRLGKDSLGWLENIDLDSVEL